MRAYDPSTDHVQPILVPRSGTHLATIEAVAAASLSAYLRPAGAGGAADGWTTWLDVAPAKSVRRVKAGAHLDQLRAWAEENGVGHAVRTLDVGEVVALEPMRYADFPRRAAGAQVNWLDYPREADRIGAGGPVEVAVMSEISTGKAAAQAAHALWHWALARLAGSDGLAELQAWERAGMPMRIRLVPADDLPAWANLVQAAAVHDAGRTEVAPGTLTAVAVDR